MQIGLRGIGTAVPHKILTNFDLEKMVDTSDEWIVTRTGIRERHVLDRDEKIADLVTKAAKSACDHAGQAPEKVDFVISATLTPDRISPAQSFEIARELGADHAFCFDMNAACTGFIYALGVAESLLQTRQVTNGLVTAGEQLTRTANYADRTSCVLFGDAASAVILTNDRPEHVILYTELGSTPSLSHEVTIGGINDLLNDRRSEYYFRQNGKTIFRFAVTKIKELFETVPGKAGIEPGQIRYVIPHQANERIIDAAATELCKGKTEFLKNIERYGNTSSASIGLVLEENWSRFEKGDYILLIGFGGGLSWGAALIQW